MTDAAGKPVSKSKVLWFNALLAAGMAVESQLAILKPILGEATYAAFAIVLVAGNAVLRFYTTQALST